jgi:ERCC4-type nuclease
MIIKIDVRESELYTKCASLIEIDPKYKAIQLISENLPLGDIIINDGQKDCVIIERKTITDLDASIKDGRYEEQSFRLNGINHHNHNIIYLIEGDLTRMNSFRKPIDKNTIYSAMFSINHFKGFSVLRTFNIDETASVLCNMVYKLVKDLKLGRMPFYSIQEIVVNEQDNLTNESSTTTNTQPSSSKDYCSVVKKVKKENINSENVGEIMLCVIPGVSSASALAILSHFKTLPNLIKCIQEDESCLNNICTTDANGKSRKISKSTISNIIDLLKN